MSVELMLAIGGLVTGIMGGIAGAVGGILAVVRTHRQAQRDATLAEYEAAYQRLKEELAQERAGRKADVERLTGLANEQSRALDTIHELHARCDREVAQQSVWIGFAARNYARVRTILQGIGQDPGELPAPPERECNLKESEFVKRQTEQQAVLVQHVTQTGQQATESSLGEKP
jgi:hypothetical protein